MSFSQTCQRCALFTVKFMAWNSLTCLILHVISNKSAGFLISGSDILEKVYHNLSQFYQSARRDQGNLQQLSEVRGFHRPSIHFYSWKLCRRLVDWFQFVFLLILFHSAYPVLLEEGEQVSDNVYKLRIPWKGEIVMYLVKKKDLMEYFHLCNFQAEREKPEASLMTSLNWPRIEKDSKI